MCSQDGKIFPHGPPKNKSGALLFPQPTIFDSLQESGQDWMMIYNDSRHETYIQSLMTTNAADHMFTMDTFFHRAEHGTLPPLTWIGPREVCHHTREEQRSVAPLCFHLRLSCCACLLRRWRRHRRCVLIGLQRLARPSR